MKVYYTVLEAAKLLDMSRGGVYWHMKKGTLTTKKTEKGEVLIDGDDIEALRQSRTPTAIAMRPNPKGTKWPTDEQIDAADISPIQKAIMKAHDTLAIAARRMGLSPSALSLTLNGHHGLSDRLAYAAEDVYGVPYPESKAWHRELMRSSGKSGNTRNRRWRRDDIILPLKRRGRVKK